MLIKIFIILIIISPNAQKKNKMAFDFYLNLPPIISFEYINTIEKNISIPAHANVLPNVIIYKLFDSKAMIKPAIEKYHAKINTFLLPIVSDITPNIKAKNPAITIKNPYVSYFKELLSQYN